MQLECKKEMCSILLQFMKASLLRGRGITFRILLFFFLITNYKINTPLICLNPDYMQDQILAQELSADFIMCKILNIIISFVFTN